MEGSSAGTSARSGGQSGDNMRDNRATVCERMGMMEEEEIFRILPGKILGNHLNLHNLYSSMILVPEIGAKILEVYALFL